MRVLFIAFFGFGDALVMLKLLEYFSIKKDVEIDIITYKRCMSIFENNKCIKNILLYEAADEKWPRYRILRYVKAFFRALSIRKYKYDIIFNNMADSKCNFLGWLMGGKKNICLNFDKNHPFVNVILPGFSIFVDRYIYIPSNVVSVYKMQEYIAKTFVEEIFPPKSVELNLTKNALSSNNNRCKIAIHPMAGARCKLWINDRWIKLIKELYNGEKIVVFCAPNEKKEIGIIFGKVLDKIDIVAENLKVFLQTLENVKLFIGLDSFSIHAAYYKNVPSMIMLSGTSNSAVWAPLSAEVVDGHCDCKYHPCFNKAKCVGTTFEYSCMKSIMAEEVSNIVQNIQNKVTT
jgi:heptosyltransferase-3